MGGTDTPTGKLGAMVKDANGQLIDLARATTNITGTTVTATQFKGYVQNIKLLADNKVSFELTQPVKEIDASGITVAGVTATGASFENKTIKDGSGNMVYGSVVTVTLPDGSLGTDIGTGADAGKLYKVGTGYQTNTLVLAQDSIKTVAGVSVPAGGVTVANSDVAAKDYAAPQIKKIYTYEKAGSTNGMIDRVVVEYSEAVKAADINKNAYTVEGYTVEDAYVVTANPTTTASPTLATTGKFVVLEVAESGRLDTDKKPVVKQVVDIRDTEDNVKAAESTASVATTDTAAPVLLSATTAQTNASKTLLSGSKAFTITLGDDLAGAYGNSAKVQIVADATNTNKVEATWDATNKVLRIEVKDAGTGTATLNDVKAAVEAVQVGGDAGDFVVNVGSNGASTIAEADAGSAVSFSGGNDVVTLTFSEALKESTIDTANFTNDFDITPATAEAGTAVLSTDKKTITLTVTTADAQVKGASIAAKTNAVEDANSTAADTTPVTIN
ncbi:hypothetical protein [Parageobacillus thermantarcticus]|uniref:hypothetical protein n=1 Tax=Parageobacillus thermantarcticus TaxID=186116 RepID=UPI0011602196|nr:hypothetical protein [Parageobacillus thermantarcticus]